MYVYIYVCIYICIMERDLLSPVEGVDLSWKGWTNLVEQVNYQIDREVYDQHGSSIRMATSPTTMLQFRYKNQGVHEHYRDTTKKHGISSTMIQFWPVERDRYRVCVMLLQGSANCDNR
jgi:hypothetical protein